MSKISKVGIRELRQKLAAYLNSDRPLAIQRRGKIIGYYVPASNLDDCSDIETLKSSLIVE